MPGFNKTGPKGQGPMTGRRMGCCTNYGANLKNQNVTTPENQGELLSGQIPGRGPGMGRGRGMRGRGLGQQNRFRSGF
jgi:hypothetical protein